MKYRDISDSGLIGCVNFMIEKKVTKSVRSVLESGLGCFVELRDAQYGRDPRDVENYIVIDI